MLKAIAIDDEPIALQVIGNLLTHVGFISMTASFTNAFKAIDFLAKNEVDLIFLDIKMPDISGIELAGSLTSPPMIIFTTAYSEHAVQSFELDAIDYLLKPFSLPRLLKACNKAYEQYHLRKNNGLQALPITSIFIKSGYEQIRVELEEILYVESNGSYMDFILDKRKIMTRMTMSEAETLLPASDFVRIHRSFIVTARKISRIDKNNVWIGQTALPIGANYAAAIDRINRRG
jgi:two-component system, LytTR family, response regulator